MIKQKTQPYALQRLLGMLQGDKNVPGQRVKSGGKSMAAYRKRRNRKNKLAAQSRRTNRRK